MEVGNNLSRDPSKTRPADTLLSNWFLGRTEASITSPLNSFCWKRKCWPPRPLNAGSTKSTTPVLKSDLGWVCVPMVVKTYGHIPYNQYQ